MNQHPIFATQPPYEVFQLIGQIQERIPGCYLHERSEPAPSFVITPDRFSATYAAAAYADARFDTKVRMIICELQEVWPAMFKAMDSSEKECANTTSALYFLELLTTEELTEYMHAATGNKYALFHLVTLRDLFEKYYRCSIDGTEFLDTCVTAFNGLLDSVCKDALYLRMISLGCKTLVRHHYPNLQEDKSYVPTAMKAFGLGTVKTAGEALEWNRKYS